MSTRKVTEVKSVVYGAFNEVGYPIPPNLWKVISPKEVLGMERPVLFATLQEIGVPRKEAAIIASKVIPSNKKRP